MLLYVNGDSHAAGAEINNTYCFAEDDPLITNNPGPHPDNIIDSFGFLLAEKLGYDFVTDAKSGASNDRILRTTKEFLLNNNNKNIFLLIQWSTFDRKEFIIDGKTYCFSPGFSSTNKKVMLKFKQYILSLTDQKLVEQTNKWHQTIYQFHTELVNNNINHLFFNSYQYFKQTKHYNWNNQFIDPYDKNNTYYHWLHNKGFHSNIGYHYKKDGHAAWANRLHNWLTTQFK
jgi:hypothetical protein